MSYNYFFKHINKCEVETIFEIGANDGKDSNKIYNFFKPKNYHLFEPKIESINQIKKNNVGNNIVIVNKAVYDTQKTLDFYICKSNPGASSILGKVNKTYVDKCLANGHPSTSKEREYFYNTYTEDVDWTLTQVDAIRLDNYCKDSNIKNIDLICIDVEGVGLKVLKSLGDMISNVKFIISECDFTETRNNNDTFLDINNYLTNKGFIVIENKFQVKDMLSDCLWKNTNYSL
jgi:FkbM family methyltransferase